MELFFAEAFLVDFGLRGFKLRRKRLHLGTKCCLPLGVFSSDDAPFNDFFLSSSMTERKFLGKLLMGMLFPRDHPPV